ncbi:type II toxin-antitoxin system RelB/DinJ family antitoxin [Gluconobacter cerinus]|uniref:type II toxin-antitoxin system RelB/DinJ family antitoxin n=1 Tax=Gluconobacter cerinus TaxID=38307 RepID=UPI001B8D021F|nr:type II toxin-antitoxin system RelB/DinJ family antitoxin [Gluconobacter cerinus]MBS0984565.1 type II toxin-antitoxin system RelB/DinJ family antitoxin [Gluconobacter cerinus]MBS0984570.1 type II toxin-antitoxin system RelB/DinJ family antitoxin [Gluconobacter cerinus]
MPGTTQINLRIDTHLKDEAYDTLKHLGTTPSDVIRDFFEYIVREKKVPFKRHVVSNEDIELLAIAKERLRTMKDTDVIKGITPHELFSRHPSNR